MQYNRLPCCRHPTTILLVDDHTDRARSLARQLTSLHCRILVFNQPQAVLDYLQDEYRPQPFTSTWDHALDFDEATRTVVPQLHHQLYSPTRFDQIAVMVTDHDLACDTDGLQLCRLMPHAHIHKILWTRVLRAAEATEAFNDGIISGYVFVDGQPHIEQSIARLKTLVNNALHKHFFSLSSFLQQAGDYHYEYQALNDPAFISLFQGFVDELKIVDYYLFDYTGCFVLVDEAGNDYTLFARDEASMIASYECDEFEKAPSHIQQQLQSKTHMLCLPQIEDRTSVPCSEWAAYIHPATVLKGEHDTYFYHLGKKLVDLQRDQILSFAAHQQQHKPVEYRLK
ncbi:MAG: response regulator [Myxococcota bacterium]